VRSIRQTSTCFDHYLTSVLHIHRIRPEEILQPDATARCSQKLIARKIYVQVACDQERMIPGANFGRDRPTYMEKDVAIRIGTEPKCFISTNHFCQFWAVRHVPWLVLIDSKT
jgi:hypothetical protein